MATILSSVKSLLSDSSSSSSDKNSDSDSSTTTTTQTNIFLMSTRVFIAGVLMPTYSVSITTGVNQTPSATITLPADPRLFKLGEFDRVPVTVFVMETMVEAPKYILIFEGFIASKSYNNTPIQREIAVQCISYFEMFKECKTTLFSSLSDAMTLGNPAVGNSTYQAAMPGIMFPSLLFYRGLGYEYLSGKDAKTITMPSQYLENIIQFVEEGGSNWDTSENPESNGSKGLDNNPCRTAHNSVIATYYAALAKNLKLDQRFEWVPYFDTAVDGETAGGKINGDSSSDTDTKAAIDAPCNMFPFLYGMQNQQAINTITGRATQQMPSGSLYDMLQFLINELDYDYCVFTNPAYHSTTGTAESVSITSGTDFEDEKFYTNLDKLEKAKYGPDVEKARLVSCCLKPMLYDTMPPQCNIIFRSQVKSVQMQIPYYGVPTRVRSTGFLQAYQRMCAENLSTAATWGNVDYFPSEKYSAYSATVTNTRYSNILASELLSIEQYCGPLIKDVNVPNWYNTIQPGSIDDANKVRERIMRRQLLIAQYETRSMTVECTFNPYITPGFPGVVFDSADTGFAFAGFITAVGHVIMANNTYTTVTMTYVRLLDEAANPDYDIPAALNSIQEVTHNQTKLAKIYEALLGTPDVTTINGAEPKTFSEIRTTWNTTESSTSSSTKSSSSSSSNKSSSSSSSSNSTSTTSPQNNIYEAYKLQRRNIITYDDYLTFMGFTQGSTGQGPEGSSTPLTLTGTFLTDRQKMMVFQPIPTAEKVSPTSDIDSVAAGAAQGVAEEDNSENTNTNSGTTTKTTNSDTTTSGSSTSVLISGQSMDVITVLKDIQSTEFARYIYK